MKRITLIVAALAFLGLAGVAAAAEQTVAVPGPNNTTVVYVVPTAGPGQKVEWVDETYKDLQPRVETVHEPRTRVVPKKYDVVHKKTVSDHKFERIIPENSRGPRLARTVKRVEKEYLKKETFMEEEEYLHPVRETVYYEVEKVRKVPALISDKCAVQ